MTILCDCGCGRPTRLAPRNDKTKGWFKGEPMRYVYGHRNRISTWPEKTEPDDFYPDLGCQASPSCQACPLPRCKYDGPEAMEVFREYMRHRRNPLLENLTTTGPVREIALLANVCQRTVYRRRAAGKI